MLKGLSAIDISATGLSAERLRMEVTANNIANANTTITDDGEPYRKKNVIFAALTDQISGDIAGVRVVGIQPDPAPFEWVHDPGHPHADSDGNVRLSNVKIPNEMIDLISASRTYEANLKAITLFKDMIEETLSLLSGGR